MRVLVGVAIALTVLRGQQELAQLWSHAVPGAEDVATRSLRNARTTSAAGRAAEVQRSAPAPVREAAPATAASVIAAPAASLAWPVPEPVEIELSADAVLEASLGSGVIITTFANFNHLDFVLNWVAHLRVAGLHNHFVGCTDDELRDELVRRRVRCARVASTMERTEAKWGSSGFAAMGRTKGALVLRLLELDVAWLLFLDLDAVVLRDPLPYLRRAVDSTGADLLMHSDALRPSAPREGVDDGAELEELRRTIAPELNTGLFLIRPTNGTRAAASAWVGVMADDRFFGNWKNDQQAFNAVLRRGMPYSAPGERVVGAFDGRVRLGVLPVHLFASGHTFMVQRLHERLRVRPFAVHVTFVNCDSAGKRWRLREAGEWFGTPDGDEHVDPSARVGAALATTAAATPRPPPTRPDERFLVVEMDLPANLTRGFEPLAAGRVLAVNDSVLHRHWALMNHQLVQLRRALALALATNRTLVLPRLMCGLETVTNFGHSGVRCPECGQQLPYLCPTDHVLRMHYWAGSPPSGPKPAVHIATREYSFLETQRRAALADRLAREHVAVELRASAHGAPARHAVPCELPQCRSPTRELLERTPAAATIVLDVPPGGALLDTDVRERLRAHARAPLVRLTGVTAADVRFADGAAHKAFAETVTWLPGGWCCAKPPAIGKPGHFFYDIWADTLPHTDRWGRHFVDRWEAIVGP